jgi:hypothetical protein
MLIFVPGVLCPGTNVFPVPPWVHPILFSYSFLSLLFFLFLFSLESHRLFTIIHTTRINNPYTKFHNHRFTIIHQVSQSFIQQELRTKISKNQEQKFQSWSYKNNNSSCASIPRPAMHPVAGPRSRPSAPSRRRTHAASHTPSPSPEACRLEEEKGN